MKIKTEELEGTALDWAVMKATGAPDDVATKLVVDGFRPSTDWAQGGPLIERFNIDLSWEGEGNICGLATHPDPEIGQSGQYGWYGKTHLVAAMRAIVGFELGDSVSIPSELFS
ncbi:uncharacterized protein DUF2591 [Modicisalibacter xianhensis]|uniref:Uncharacterized protein DUF2591 n=1 Tax=Modicisalibacter xianhensis TaxID=442341 RepID=A0A4R8FHL6_9GAMM|nr:phage protein NinX family protein [Halomonas xianhensis]TDX21651.1 uncharacterized protein DUF2591 [Halomonas xianhensis]